MWQSLFPCTPRQVQLSSSFLSTCNWRSPKSDWAVPVTLTKKRRKVSKTWWSEWIIGWHKLEQEAGGNTSFTALMRRLLTAKRHTASYLGSPFMSHRLPAVAGWQQAVSSTTWPHLQFTPAIARYICSSSIKFFHLKMTLGLAFGESWLLLAQPRTNTDVYKGLFPWEGFRTLVHCIYQALFQDTPTALDNLKMANDGVEPGTSTTAFMRTFPMPTPHVNCQLSSVILRVFSIVRRGNWVGSVALHLICGRACPKSDWAVPMTLTKKRSESFQDMMKRMNNWLAQIRTRSRRKHILHCTHAKIIVHVSPVAGWQQAVSSTTWPHLQFTPAMARYICSSSIKFFHLKMTLGLAFGESWLLLAQPRTNTDVYKGLFPWEGFRYG